MLKVEYSMACVHCIYSQIDIIPACKIAEHLLSCGWVLSYAVYLDLETENEVLDSQK